MSTHATDRLGVQVELRRGLLLIAIILSFVAVVYSVATSKGLTEHFSVLAYSQMAGLVWFIAGCLIFVSYGISLLSRKLPHPLHQFYADIRANVLAPRFLLMRLAPLIMIPILLGTFTSFKGMIPHVHPFSMDPLFHEIDKALFFGIEPWRITHALFGNAWATYFLNFLYTMWFFAMWLSVMYMTVSTDRPFLRSQFLISFVLCWVLIGSLMATLMSSAGPCFYFQVLQDGTYLPLMQSLRDIDQALLDIHPALRVYALQVQDMLWQAHTEKFDMLGSGISAMPSLHVSIATLMMLAAFHINRRFGWIMLAYLVLIQIGSVHLGWHYAIDGLVSGPATFAIWRFSAWLLRATAPEPMPAPSFGLAAQLRA